MKLLVFFLSLLMSPSVYNAVNPVPLAHGQVITVWSGETPTPGNGTMAASQQVALSCGNAGNGCPFAVDGKFSGAPGVFEVDVQLAAVDADTNYQTCVAATCQVATVDATNNTFHVDGSLQVGKYARLLMRSRTNSVTVTATFTGG